MFPLNPISKAVSAGKGACSNRISECVSFNLHPRLLHDVSLVIHIILGSDRFNKFPNPLVFLPQAALV